MSKSKHASEKESNDQQSLKDTIESAVKIIGV